MYYNKYMKKFIVILSCLLFMFSCVSGGVLLTQSLPYSISEESENFYEEDGKVSSQASGYWSSYRSTFAGGTGTSSNPYKIATAQQLAQLAYYSNSSSYYSTYNTKHYELVNNIDLSEHYWVPIGKSYLFRGHFEGNFHVIKGLTCYIDSSTSSYYSLTADGSNVIGAGLFGAIKGNGSNVVIQNFALVDVDISTASTSISGKQLKMGSVVSFVEGSTSSDDTAIRNINVFGNLRSYFTNPGTSSRIGGIAGHIQYTTISMCESYVTIMTSSNQSSSSTSNLSYCVGGIAGYCDSEGDVRWCAMLGYIDSYLVAGGGIAGAVYYATIEGCYVVRGAESTSSSINKYYFGTRDCGGLVGTLQGNGIIRSCWASVGVSSNSGGSPIEGGIAGTVVSGRIYCCVWNTGLTYSPSVQWTAQGSCTYNNIVTVSSSNSSWFRRSSNFVSYMNKTNGVAWTSSYWTINDSSSGHLNYGFPYITNLKVNVNSAGKNSTSISYTYSGAKTSDCAFDTAVSSASSTTSIYALLGCTIDMQINAAGYVYGVYDILHNQIYNGEDINAQSCTIEAVVSSVYNAYNPGSRMATTFYIVEKPLEIGYWDSSFNYASSFAGGSGLASDPWQINTAAQLARLAYLSNSSSYSTYNDDYYILTNNINLSGRIWIPIGLKYAFSGDFNGDGYVINGLTCTMYSSTDSEYNFTATSSNSYAMGFFGYINDGAQMHDFVLTGVDFGAAYSSLFLSPSSSMYIGGIACRAGGSSTNTVEIYDVGVWGGISDDMIGIKSSRYIGGLVGYVNNYTNISESFNYANIYCGKTAGHPNFDIDYDFGPYTSAYGYAGGLVGYFCASADVSSVQDCYNAGDIVNIGRTTGGLIGYLYLGTNILRCYNAGEVRGYYYRGGLVGYSYSSSAHPVEINNSFNEGDVSSQSTTYSYEGAFTGYNGGSYTTINYCTYNSEKTTDSYGSGTAPTFVGLYTYDSTSETSPTTTRKDNVFTTGEKWNITYVGLTISSTVTWTHPARAIRKLIIPTSSENETTGYANIGEIVSPGIGGSGPSVGVIDPDIGIVGPGVTIDPDLGTIEGPTYLNNSLPVLSWSLRSISTSSNISNLGTTQVNLKAGNGTTQGGIEQASSRYAILGQDIVITASDPQNSYGKFTGICEGYLSENFVSTLQSYTTYVKNGITLYIGVYSSTTTVRVYQRVAVYSSYDGALNYPTSAQQVGVIKSSRYSTGDPWDTTQSTASTYYTSILSYMYRSVTFSYVLNNSAYKFKGWYRTTSIALSVSTVTGTPTSTAASISYTPTTTTTYYYFAVFVPNEATTYFDGTWVSYDDGTSYTEENYSVSIGYVEPIFSNISNLTPSIIEYNDQTLPIQIKYANNTRFMMTYNTASNNFSFDGWYYSSSPITSSNIANATFLSSSRIYSNSDIPPLNGKYFFAKFTRKISSITFRIKTSENGSSFTETNPSNAVSPTIKYYNEDNVLVSHTMTDTVSTVLNVQAGTTINISDPDGIYNIVSISTSSNNPTNTTAPSMTASCPTTATTYYIFYRKNSENMLKYDNERRYWYFEDGEYPQSYAELEWDMVYENSNYYGAKIYYDSFSKTLTLDGTLSASPSSTGANTIFRVGGLTFTEGQVYTVNYEYISGEVVTTGSNALVVDVSTSSWANPSTRNNLDRSLSMSSVSGNITINSASASSGTGFRFWIWRGSGSTISFNNYKIRVSICYDKLLDSASKTTLDQLDNPLSSSNKITIYNVNTAIADMPANSRFANVNGRWFKVEPVRWRVSDYGVSSTNYPYRWNLYKAYNEDFTVVSDQVLMIGAVASGGWGENWAFTDGELYANMTDISDSIDASYFTILTNKYYVYNVTNRQDKVSSVTNESDNAIRVASVDEISECVGNLSSTASDLVCFLLGYNSGEYTKYWTRNLGSMGNGIVINAGGEVNNALLSNIFGVRFAMTMSEGMRE